VEAAISLLAQAVERLADDNPHSYFIPDLDESGQLEVLRGLIGRRKEGRKFVISFADVELNEDDIWPDGAPENPTPEDVIDVMKENECAHPMNVVAEWLLVLSLFVTTTGGDDTVEWDGT
jgi:hypothetical protein